MSVLRRVGLLFALCLTALAVVHPWIFSALASGMIRDDPHSRADCAVIVGGDGRYDWVGQRVDQGNIAQVLLIRSVPQRLNEFEVLRLPHQVAQSELLQRGVDAEDLVVIGPPARDAWEVADRLEDWLVDRPDATVACVVDRLGSGSVDAVFRQVLSPEAYGRVRIHALRDRRYDESNWWKSRRGMKSFFGAATAYLSARFAGRPAYRFNDTWDPDRYEQELIQGLPESEERATTL